MATRPEVLSDIASLRQALRHVGSPHLPLLKLHVWRPMGDLAVDLAAIAISVSVALGEPWAWPVALLVLGNRQRALGNILHDAAHRNLTRVRWLNDLLARCLIAPLLFLSLSRYRDLHFRHHLELGSPDGDPDLIPIPLSKASSWPRAVAVNALSRRAILGSTFGHLLDGHVSAPARLFIVAWWGAMMTILVSVAGPAATATALALWMASRVTVFHLITTFREMCDHHGLSPGGVFSFTRDIEATGAWGLLIHPRNNAYHLTHHLLPAVPYYRLPQAQRLFSTLPEYRSRGHVCNSYFSCPAPVVLEWQREACP